MASTRPCPLFSPRDGDPQIAQPIVIEEKREERILAVADRSWGRDVSQASCKEVAEERILSQGIGLNSGSGRIGFFK